MGVFCHYSNIFSQELIRVFCHFSSLRSLQQTIKLQYILARTSVLCVMDNTGTLFRQVNAHTYTHMHSHSQILTRTHEN